MPRIAPVNPAAATGPAAEQLAATKAALGSIPNLFATAAQAPAALQAMNAFFGALGTGVLGAKVGERIAIAVAQQNRCDYCLAAHTAIGGLHGVEASELAAAKRGQSADARSAAAMTFALDVLARRGQVDDAAIAAARKAGFADAELVEIVAHVALNVFTNYLNNVAQTVVDFPPVALDAAA
jgi:uncharacterized peroxidase-related enzyme